MSLSAPSSSVKLLNTGDLREADAMFEGRVERAGAGGTGVGGREPVRVGAGEFGGGVIGCGGGGSGAAGAAEDLVRAATCACILARLSTEPEEPLPYSSPADRASDPPSRPASFLKSDL